MIKVPDDPRRTIVPSIVAAGPSSENFVPVTRTAVGFGENGLIGDRGDFVKGV